MKPATPLRAHQKQSIAFFAKTPIVFDMSDPGTGKTACHVTTFAARRRKRGGKLLVVAPKSLLVSAWVNDFKKFAPDMKCSVAYASNRMEALNKEADVYITNHDAVKVLAKLPASFWKDFDSFISDECFPTGSLVDTPMGPIPIEMLECGDLVYTSSGALPISNIFTNQIRTLVELEFEDGTKITCTENHPIATTEGWVEAWRTRGMSAVRLDIHKLDQQRSNLLRAQLQPISNVDFKNTKSTQSYSQEKFTQITRSSKLEQRNSMPRRNKTETQRRSYCIWSQAEKTRREWTNSSLRKNDERNATPILGISIFNTYWKTQRQRLRNFIQTGFRTALQKMGIGNRWKFTYIAETLGCEKRYITGTTRVVSVSRIECTSPCMVYNIQVNGPHNYSVNGFLVHNCTAYKHHTSARSKAVAKLVKQHKNFKYRANLSGTPTSNGICDIWHQIYILDEGKRLGKSFFAFRSAVCTPTQIGNNVQAIKWEDKQHAEATVSSMISDIVIRHKFEDCVDIPANHQYSVEFQLSKKHMALYKELEDNSILALKNNKVVTAINAAVLYGKLLQTSSGAVYSETGNYSIIDRDRYDLVLDLAEARPHVVIFFAWSHQKECLIKEANARGLSHCLIDGTVGDKARETAVKEFQAGLHRIMFAHPQSAGHGLTLTRGVATIWASPTPNLEHYLQGLKRIHRIGQTEKTETIMVLAPGTIEERVYESLMAKDVKMTSLLNYLKAA